MSCSTVQTPCLSTQASLMFFKGTKGDKGDKGDDSTVAGPPGPAGELGPIGVYTGTYDGSSVYYDTEIRRDLVYYAGNFWATNNAAKSGTSGWGAPNTSDDWVPFGVPIPIVATKLELLYPSEIAFGITMLPGVFPGGYIKSSNFVQNVTGEGMGWLLSPLGYLEANDQNSKFNGLISTDSPRFNFESIINTMPQVGYAQFVFPAPIVDGDIPENPDINYVTDDDLIIFGWKEGAANFIENRFGNTNQKFQIILEGIGTNTSAGSELFYIQIYFRTRDNGGAWDAWVKIGQDFYMQKLAALDQSFQVVKNLALALGGTQDIQFAAGFSKGAGGTATVSGAMISVEVFN